MLDTIEANTDLRAIMENLSVDLPEVENRREAGDELLDMMDNI